MFAKILSNFAQGSFLLTIGLMAKGNINNYLDKYTGWYIIAVEATIAKHRRRWKASGGFAVWCRAGKCQG